MLANFFSERSGSAYTKRKWQQGKPKHGGKSSSHCKNRDSCWKKAKRRKERTTLARGSHCWKPQESTRENQEKAHNLNAHGRNRRLGGPRTAKLSPFFQTVALKTTKQKGNTTTMMQTIKENLIQRPQNNGKSPPESKRKPMMRWRKDDTHGQQHQQQQQRYTTRHKQMTCRMPPTQGKDTTKVVTQQKMLKPLPKVERGQTTQKHCQKKRTPTRAPLGVTGDLSPIFKLDEIEAAIPPGSRSRMGEKRERLEKIFFDAPSKQPKTCIKHS